MKTTFFNRFAFFLTLLHAIAVSEMQLLANPTDSTVHSLQDQFDPVVFENALQNALEDENYELVGKLYLTKGRHFGKMHRNDSLVAIYLKALDILRDQPLDSIKGELHHQLGSQSGITSNYDGAMSHYNRAMAFARSKADSASIFNSMATLEYDFDHYDEAMKLYHRSLRMYKALGRKGKHAMVNANIGNVHDVRGAYDSAIVRYKASLQVYRQWNPTPVGGICWLMSIIGSTYVNKGSYELAVIYLDSAQEVANKYDMDEWEQFIYERKADLYQEVGNFAKGLEYFQLFVKEKDSIALEASRSKIAEIENHYNLLEKDRAMELQEAKIQNLKLRELIGIFTVGVLGFFLAGAIAARRSAQHVSTQLKSQKVEIEELNLSLQDKVRRLETVLTDLKLAQDQLVQQEKLATLGVLVSGIGHEINNPLNFIEKGVEVLEAKLTDEEMLSHHQRELDAIREGTSRIATIGKRLQLYYEIRNSNSPAASSDPNAVIANCLQMVTSGLSDEKDIHLKTDFGAVTEGVAINDLELQHLVLNLLYNAVEAIEKHGHVVVATKSNLEQRVFEVSIRDDGQGIKEEHLPRLGDPFFSTKKIGTAKGLGLFTTFEIIRNARGTHQVISEVGVGTTVILSIPLI